MAHPILLLVLVLVVIAVNFHAVRRQYENTQAQLTDWAHTNHLIILRETGMSLPSSRWSTTKKVRYHAEVLDESTHRIRRAWVTFGSSWWGSTIADAFDARWDDDAGGTPSS